MKVLEGYRKGINLGGWLSQCGDKYNDEHYSSFIVEKDIETIASWGADHVRVPIDYNVIVTEEGEFIESGFAYIDNCIEWCQKYNLKMIFDIHKAKGFVFDNPEYVGFFGDAELQDFFIRLWEEIITRYGKYSHMMAFELLNEVTEARFAQPWNEISGRTIEAIRKINKDVTLIIGGVFNSSIFGLTQMNPPADDNIVYTIHVYSPFIFTHQNAYWIHAMPKGYHIGYPGTVKEYFAETQKVFNHDFDGEFEGLDAEIIDVTYFDHLFALAIDSARKLGVSLYCGEYGVIDQTSPEDALRWYKDINVVLEKNNIPRAAWTYKNMDFGLSDERMAGVLPELLKYI